MKTGNLLQPNHIIQYEELPPGNYKLDIQASRSGNYFQAPGRIIEITIILHSGKQNGSAFYRYFLLSFFYMR